MHRKRRRSKGRRGERVRERGKKGKRGEEEEREGENPVSPGISSPEFTFRVTVLTQPALCCKAKKAAAPET